MKDQTPSLFLRMLVCRTYQWLSKHDLDGAAACLLALLVFTAVKHILEIR
jgi:hypothetical protein